MKTGILLMAALAALAAEAGTPLPPQVLYGRVRDSYGFPCTSGQLRVLRGSNECARFTFSGILPDAMNYRLSLDMDSGGGRYAPYAVQAGETLTLSVESGGVPQPLIPTSSLIAGPAGSTRRLDLCIGVDADGDGLPDAWENQLLEQSGGRLTRIEDVRPGDDFDGDGMTNDEEFRAGTFAFLDTDLLEVGDFEPLPGGLLKLRFLTSPGMTYRLVGCGSLALKDWIPLRFSAAESGPLAYRELVGDGAYKTVYIESRPGSLFIRLGVQEP